MQRLNIHLLTNYKYCTLESAEIAKDITKQYKYLSKNNLKGSNYRTYVIKF